MEYLFSLYNTNMYVLFLTNGIMKKSTIIISLGILISCSSTATWAQGRAWKCSGNYYTNDSQEAKKMGCEQVKDANVTYVNYGTTSRPTTGTPSTASGGNTLRTPTPTRTATPPLYNPNSSPTQVSEKEQQGLDSGAKRLLERELQNEQNALTKLQQEYNNGAPERYLSEAEDDTLYQVRVDRLSREIEVKVANIVAIENEIARLK